MVTTLNDVSVPSLPARTTPPWPEIGLLLLAFGLRLHRLTLFPLFIDEAFHIRWARETLALHPFGGIPDGKPLIGWALAPLWPFENALWVSRAAIVLAGTLGLAALLGIGRSLLGRRSALVAGLVYAFLPYAFFFERLALADPLAAALGLVAGWLIVVGLRGEDRRLAALAGAALALAVLGKLPMVVMLAVPALAWLLLAPRRDALPLLLWMYVVCLAILAPVFALGWWRTAATGLGNAQRFTSVAPGTLPLRLWSNARLFGVWLGQYVGWPVLAMAGAGIVWGAVRRERGTLFIAGLALLPTLEFWVLSTHPLPRYYLLGTGAMLLLAGAFACWIVDRLRAVSTWAARIVGLAGLLIVLAPAVGFLKTAYTAPASLPLVTMDRLDYIELNTSGYGLEDAALWLESYAARSPGVTVICTARITCDRLSVYLYGTPGLRFARTDVLTPDWVHQETSAGRTVLLTEDDPPHGDPFDPGAEYELEPVARFERPGRQSRFEVYYLERKR